MDSLSSTTSIDKEKGFAGGTRVTPAAAAHPVLADVDEKDEDEGAHVAGYQRNEYTQEEADAVKRKLDRRVMPLLAAVYLYVFRSRHRRSSSPRSRPDTACPGSARSSSTRTALPTRP